MTQGYFFFDGKAIALKQDSNGLWQMNMAMNSDEQNSLGDAISQAMIDMGIPQAIADASAAENPDTPNTDEATLVSAGVHVNTLVSLDQTTPKFCSGTLLFLNVTAAAGVLKTLSLIIDAKDPASGVYSPICSTGIIGTTVTGVGAYLLFACPFVGSLLSGLFGSVVQLPRTWRARVVPSDSSNWTYSVGRCYLR